MSTRYHRQFVPPARGTSSDPGLTRELSNFAPGIYGRCKYVRVSTLHPALVTSSLILNCTALVQRIGIFRDPALVAV